MRAAVSTMLLILASTLPGCRTPEEPEPDGADAHAEAMSAEHAGDRPEASPATEPQPSRPVSTDRVAYATISAEEVTGYLARPLESEPGTPAVIVIHEWWGLNDNIEAMARRLAGEGYPALAVDLYRGRTASDPEGARELMQGVSEEGAATNLRQAYSYLTEELGASRVGVIGWCFGGGWSLKTALLLPGKIDAAVMYYGRVITDRTELAPLDSPLLGLFGAEDGGIPVEGVREFEGILQDLGKEAEIHVYEGAGHAFANPSGRNYRPEAAEDAWERTLAFFERNLSSR